MTTNLARAIKVIDRTAEKVGTRAPLLAQGAQTGASHRKGILTMNRTAGLYLTLAVRIAERWANS